MARPVGRPRSFDRGDALRRAAHLFWQHGFSGTSTRMLTAALGISTSSLYSAFGTKDALFDEVVRTYASRYSAIYAAAVTEPTVHGVIDRLLTDSATEFTRTDEGHPGCLTSSAVMADAPPTLDVRGYVAELQGRDEARLRARLEQAEAAGDLPPAVGATALTELVQTVWQGLSCRAELGATRDELVGVARLTAGLIAPGAPASR
ncbi:TetR/AcrR family transcriptional regulator [Desertihabitans aurantiacus]|uniref:TetR/AcrR family transcriptional regulator n=1 Tax=Desertihabitans aurantiacus TaxID=2282477 RepID=UPI000DF76B8D|nr:TetR/AcrR family transcriptional regulator [Desertihabitans aurantiacus]